MLIMVKSFLWLSYHYRSHFMKWSNPHNQIYLGEINNDNISQSVDAINQ